MTIPAPGVGKTIRITDVLMKAAGTITGSAFAITTTSGTVHIGSGGATATATGVTSFNFARPINCVANDAPIITFTMAGATAASLFATVNYEVSPA